MAEPESTWMLADTLRSRAQEVRVLYPAAARRSDQAAEHVERAAKQLETAARLLEGWARDHAAG